MALCDRCSGLENQTMEQAMFIGAQKAVLQIYLKKDARTAKRIKANSPR